MQYVGLLEVQRRLRITAKSLVLPSWLSATDCPMTVHARLGRFTQVCLFPAARDPFSPERTSQLVVQAPLDSDSVDYSLSDTLRYSVGYEEVTIRYEDPSDRFTLTLSKGLHLLGLIPEVGDAIVVLAVGDSLELWKPEAWNKFRTDFAAEMPKRLTELNDFLDA